MALEHPFEKRSNRPNGAFMEETCFEQKLSLRVIGWSRSRENPMFPPGPMKPRCQTCRRPCVS